MFLFAVVVLSRVMILLAICWNSDLRNESMTFLEHCSEIGFLLALLPFLLKVCSTQLIFLDQSVLRRLQLHLPLQLKNLYDRDSSRTHALFLLHHEVQVGFCGHDKISEGWSMLLCRGGLDTHIFRSRIYRF